MEKTYGVAKTITTDFGYQTQLILHKEHIEFSGLDELCNKTGIQNIDVRKSQIHDININERLRLVVDNESLSFVRDYRDIEDEVPTKTYIQELGSIVASRFMKNNHN